MDLGEIIVGFVPWLIPLFLLGSWLVNHKTPNEGGGRPKDSGNSAQTSKEGKPPSSRDKEGAMSDKDMTGV